MRQADQINILNENTISLQEAIKWLKRSLLICEKYNQDDLNPEGMVVFEGLTSRFARLKR